MAEFLWVEKYRPHKVEDCILPERLKKIFQSYVNSKNIPNLMLTGSAGVGKTTVAMAMCEEIGLNYLFINASKERGINELVRDKVSKYASTIAFAGGRKVIILDEADYMTPEAQASLRGAIEEFSENCTFIFTCNFKSKLIDALHSRCAGIDFNLSADEKKDMGAQFYQHAQKILDSEGIKYEKKVLAQLVIKHLPDYRRTINELQRYSSFGAIDAGLVSQLTDVRKISDLVTHLKEKNFSEMRKWCVTNSDIEPSRIYRKIYDSMSEYFKPDSIPQAIVVISRYQYQAAFVADQEINLVACLTELMVDCEYV